MSVVAEHKQGTLFMLVGPGGVGKNAVLDQLLVQVSDIKQLATATTRGPRKGEEHGKQRWFVTLDEFKQMIADEKLVEYQEVHAGVYYGVPKFALESAFEAGQDLVADIDFHGAIKIRAGYMQNSISIFVAPPNMDILAERLIARQDSQQSIDDRLHRAAEEMLYATEADFVIVNWNLDDAIKQAIQLITALRQKSPNILPNITTTFSTTVTISSTGQKLMGTVLKGEKPTRIALNLLRDNGIVQPDANHLFFAKTPITVDFDEQQRRYHIDYEFVYEDGS
ncbi:MAG: hypothetical protein MUE54_03675 [Anaerolineae bacterium]|jgi:guanylate kinase|nr:hypothetical protein [Anaerolineae bacterium]